LDFFAFKKRFPAHNNKYEGDKGNEGEDEGEEDGDQGGDRGEEPNYSPLAATQVKIY